MPANRNKADGKGKTLQTRLSHAGGSRPSGAMCEVMISFDRMQAVAKRSMGHANECAHIVPWILEHPTAIFEGLRQDDDEDLRGYGWRCYCGVPKQAFNRDGTNRSPYLDQVYLVFVNDDEVAYNWRWEKSDPDNPNLPIDHAVRFKEQIL